MNVESKSYLEAGGNKYIETQKWTNLTATLHPGKHQ